MARGTGQHEYGNVPWKDDTRGVRPEKRLPANHMIATLTKLLDRPWAPWALTAVLVAFYSFWIAVKVDRRHANDFYVYYVAAEAFSRNQDAYQMDLDSWHHLAQEKGVEDLAYPYYYPPLTAMLVAPFKNWPPQRAALLWQAVSALAFVAAAWLAGAAGRYPRDVSLALILSLGLTSVLSTFWTGQVNALLSLALAAGFYATRRNRPVLGGIALGLGAMLKVIPAAHLLYALGTRRRRLFVAGVLTIGVAFAAALPFMGWAGLFGFWGRTTLLLAPMQLRTFPNQALSGLAVALSQRWASTLWVVSAGLIVCLTAWACWPRGAEQRFFEEEFALVTVMVNLIMPHTYRHQMVTLLIPILVLTKQGLLERQRRWTLPVLTIGYGLTALCDFRKVLSWGQDTWLIVVPTGWMLLLWVLLAAELARAKSRPLSGSG